MALRKIKTIPSFALAKKSRAVEPDEIGSARVNELIDDMWDTLRANQGLGLAAVQVGVLKRIIVIDMNDEDDPESKLELINPKIVESSGEQRESEACLSIPHRSGVTLRPEYVKLEALDRNGEKHVYEAHGLKARCFCHETDHLDGILYSNRLAPGEKMQNG
ncbi:MAG: peptide deformylase [Clostridiales bacterium]|nr:peptide deformylase [Clostridiales bacterium]